jgi:hypothetical protein
MPQDPSGVQEDLDVRVAADHILSFLERDATVHPFQSERDFAAATRGLGNLTARDRLTNAQPNRWTVRMNRGFDGSSPMASRISLTRLARSSPPRTSRAKGGSEALLGVGMFWFGECRHCCPYGAPKQCARSQFQPVRIGKIKGGEGFTREIEGGRGGPRRVIYSRVYSCRPLCTFPIRC